MAASTRCRARRTGACRTDRRFSRVRRTYQRSPPLRKASKDDGRRIPVPGAAKSRTSRPFCFDYAHHWWLVASERHSKLCVDAAKPPCYASFLHALPLQSRRSLDFRSAVPPSPSHARTWRSKLRSILPSLGSCVWHLSSPKARTVSASRRERRHGWKYAVRRNALPDRRMG